jgi:putative Holliday junction resolvase
MRALGIDYGRRRIGLALSDASGTLARPWKCVPGAANVAQAARALAGEIAEAARDGAPVEVIVLGLPRRLNGEPTEQTGHVRALADHLRAMVALPLVFQDERLSSREAEALLARNERDWRKRKALLDAMAAAVILQDYLDSRAPQALDTRPDTKKEDE